MADPKHGNGEAAKLQSAVANHAREGLKLQQQLNKHQAIPRSSTGETQNLGSPTFAADQRRGIERRGCRARPQRRLDQRIPAVIGNRFRCLPAPNVEAVLCAGGPPRRPQARLTL